MRILQTAFQLDGTLLLSYGLYDPLQSQTTKHSTTSSPIMFFFTTDSTVFGFSQFFS